MFNLKGYFCSFHVITKFLCKVVKLTTFQHLQPLLNVETVNPKFAQTLCADLDELEILLNMEKSVALGEIGLDYSARNHGKIYIYQSVEFYFVKLNHLDSRDTTVTNQLILHRSVPRVSDWPILLQRFR